MPTVTMKHFFLTAVVLSSCIHLFAGGTNWLFFTTDESGNNISDDKGGTNEYFPAEQFPEGNWGKATNDLQLSLRFNKSIYTNGEPIVATILIRNVGNRHAEYVAIHVGGKDGPVRFIATSIDNHELDPVQGGPVSALSDAVAAGKQRKFVERFDKDYFLTNGTYFVQAYVMPRRRLEYIESARVPIKIVSQLATEH